MFKLSKYAVIAALPTNAAQSLCFSTKTGEMLLIPTKVFDFIKNKEWNNLKFNELLELARTELLVCEDEDETNFIFKFDEMSQNNSILLSTIQPTANCQLDCHYCGQVHSNVIMSDEILQKMLGRIKHIILTNPNYKTVCITWYGGEPLMALDCICKFYEDMFKFCEENSINYISDIITNGLLLTLENFEILMKCKITSIQITIDGPKETHDKRRITKNGKGSFDMIFNNLCKVVHSEIYSLYKPKIILRINIDSTNYEEVPILIDFLKKNNIFNKVNVFFAPIIEWGDNEADKVSLTTKEFAEKEIEWLILLYQNGQIHKELLPIRKSLNCMVNDKYAEDYDSFGNIFPCYEFAYTPIYQNDDCIEGNVENDTKPEDKKIAKIRNFKNEFLATKNKCTKCKFLPVCYGSCPKKWRKGADGCPTFKYNIQDRMILQYISQKTI
ncbi:MAG: radical SAM protein [Prevotellaceae bacterium]|jgi:uncharacterized protein|nr:radical SAM protein [Prevotellaceae bacterium]